MCCLGVCVRRARVCAWCLRLAACVRVRSMMTHPRSPCDSDLCKCPLPKHSTHVEPALGRCHRTISTHTHKHTLHFKFLYHARCDTVKLYHRESERETEMSRHTLMTHTDKHGRSRLWHRTTGRVSFVGAQTQDRTWQRVPK
jgi:hypothetical protein